MKFLRVLVIEDDVLTATAIQEALLLAKHTVIGPVRDQKEMQDCLAQAIPDIALVDINLGNDTTDGISLVEELRQNYSFPIIYLTAYSDEATVTRAKLTRPAAYMLKPLDPRELAIQIEVVFLNQLSKSDSSSEKDSLYLPVDAGKGHIRVQKNEVLYLKASGAYVKMYLQKEPEKANLFSMNLGYLSQFFENSQFHRLSRSLVVNLHQIERVEKAQIFFSGISKPIEYPENKHTELLKKLQVIKTA